MTPNNLSRLRISLFILALFSFTCRAEVVVFFWHDAQGLIHFSTQRPMGIGQVYAVHMPSYSSEAEHTTKPLTYEALFNEARQEAEAVEKVALAKAAVAELARQCDDAKRGKSTLLNNRRVQATDSNGQRHDMTVEEKQAELDKLDARIKDSCQTPPAA